MFLIKGWKLEIKIYQVDAFTSKAFSGNPAAVCILEREAEESWMQNLASEMNLSETAFLYMVENGINLRWFTPTVEVDLCGHATLASAHILWEEGLLKPGEDAHFHTRSGLLKASKNNNFIELDFPTEPELEASMPKGLDDALAINPLYIGKNRFDYLVEIDSEQTLRDLDPNFSLLKTIPARGIIVTSLSEYEEYDFVSRFFAPASGIDEDPVTGSAHCCLGPYWQKRLGKEQFKAYQVSKRGGEVKVVVRGDRVILGGNAVTVFRGDII